MTEQPCELCAAPVIMARLAYGGRSGGYKRIVLERCPEGEGRIAMFPTLFAEPGLPLAEEVVNGTAYRPHREHCARASHSAGAFKRKVKEGSSDT